MSFVNQTFGDQRGIYQKLATSDLAATQIEMTAGATTAQRGAWQLAVFNGAWGV
jgi:hypothetical protein